MFFLCLLTTKCFNAGELGRFETIPGVSYMAGLPVLATQNTVFILTTSSNKSLEEYLSYEDPSSVQNSNYNASCPTYVITHGLGGQPNDTAFVDMQNALFRKVT